MSKLTDRAKELELEGNLEVALTYYEMALSDKSSSFDVRNDFGRVLNKLADYKEALDCFNLVLAMDDKNFEAWFGKGISNLGLNKWDESLISFKKALEIDDADANCYYYLAIIHKEFGEDLAQDYYTKFLSLENTDFKKIREYYKFGLIFKQRDLELENSDKKININGYVNLLRDYNLTDDEITCFLRTLPENKLKEKIIFFNDLKYENDEKRLIFEKLSDLGLDDDNINELFKMNSVETLKNEVISQCGVNPFQDKQNPPEIPLYLIEMGTSESKQFTIDFKDMPLLIASKYDKFDKLLVKKHFLDPIKRLIYRKRYNAFKKGFKLIKSFIDESNYDGALRIMGYAYPDLSKIPENSLKINFMFYKASLLAINNKPKEALDLFNDMEKLDSNLKYDSIYLFNKGNALYDSGKYDESIKCYTSWEYDDRETFIIASAYYKISDFKKAFEFYNTLSDEYQDEKVLENIKNKL